MAARYAEGLGSERHSGQHAVSYLPTDDKERKMLPMFKMITGYFSKALREVTRVCVANNVRYNPGKDPADIHWARGKSKDQLGSSFRHMMEAAVDGKVFEDEVSAADGKPIYILAENAWRALAALEVAIEEQEAKKVPDIQALNADIKARSFEKGLATDLLDLPHPPDYSNAKAREEPRMGCNCVTCTEIRRIAATST